MYIGSQPSERNPEVQRLTLDSQAAVDTSDEIGRRCADVAQVGNMALAPCVEEVVAGEATVS